ncbi:MAG: class I SAM-dependent methyltransferase [Anaerolineales bacterium]|nr:class I SAM-dependent methyltransferase [Anaerolineales bacterium]
MEEWAGQRILEVGAGIGNCTEFIIDREKVVCLALHSDAFAHFKEMFSDASSVIIVQGDVADPSIRSLETHQFDSAMCFNVLEHVEDAVLATSWPGNYSKRWEPAMSKIAWKTPGQ